MTAQTTELVPVNPVSAPPVHLDGLAECVRRMYPECKKHFAAFNEYRFMIGLCLLKARNLLAIAPGDRNSTGRNQFTGASGQLVQWPHSNGLTPINAQNDPYSKQLTNPHANFTQESAGLMLWAKKEFPNFNYRTLSRYREFAEFRALPALLKAREQLQLDLSDISDLDLFALPAERRSQVAAVLKSAVTTKDLALTLRSMGEIPGDPDHFGPKGGPRMPHGKRTKKEITEANWRNQAQSWFARFQPLLSDVLVTEFQTARYYDLLTDDQLEGLKNDVYDLHTKLVATQIRRKHRRVH